MRIVTHTCSNTEIVCALGMGEHIVGVDDHSDYPPEVVEAVSRIGADQDIDVERVVALEPDLVISSLTIPGHEQCVQRLKETGLPLLVLEPTRLSHIPRDIRAIAQALDVPERGEALAASFEDAIGEEPSGDEAPVDVLVEWWPKPVIVPGAHSWVTRMLELAGGRNPWAGVPEKSVPVDDEEVLEADPAAVVIAWCGVPFRNYRPEIVRRREAWRELKALERDQIHCVSEALLGRPGPRLVQGLAALKDIVAAARDGSATDLRFA